MRKPELLALALAAFASIATSKAKGWSFDANISNDAPGKSRVAFVEATHEPDVVLDNGELLEPLGGYYTGIWNGTARYLIPADRSLSRIWIHGGCGGLCAGTCAPPENAVVKLLSVKPVATWEREATSPTVTDDLSSDRTEIPIVASHPFRFEVIASGRKQHASQRDNRIVIDWGEPEPGAKTAWSIKVTMTGLCDDGTVCNPPPDAKLEIGAPVRVPPRKR